MAKKIIKKAVAKKLSLTEEELDKLAESGTKEAIAKIEAYLKVEKDQEKKAYAQMALDECELFYYQPQNEKEEDDFLLCVLINRKQDALDELYIKAGQIQDNLDRFRIEQKVHKRVIAGNKDRKDIWQYRYIDDLITYDLERLEEIKDDIDYEETWIAEAEKMIKTPRYKKGIPSRHLYQFDFGLEDDLFEDDAHDCGCGCYGDEELENVPF